MTAERYISDTFAFVIFNAWKSLRKFFRGIYSIVAANFPADFCLLAFAKKNPRRKFFPRDILFQEFFRRVLLADSLVKRVNRSLQAGFNAHS